MNAQLDRFYQNLGVLLNALAMLACGLMALLTLLVCADVAIRIQDRTGVPWANEVSEYILYLMTFLAAPLLLREGGHIRVDVFLRLMPRHAAWAIECFVDLSGALVSAVFLVSSFRAAWASYAESSLIIKTLSFPEWWLLVPVPVCMALMTIEFLFRFRRLLSAEKAMRQDGVGTI
ncbi:MAG: TRAP transporter small permease [Nitrospira sp.]